jgi:hypothetical protein
MNLERYSDFRNYIAHMLQVVQIRFGSSSIPIEIADRPAEKAFSICLSASSL